MSRRRALLLVNEKSRHGRSDFGSAVDLLKRQGFELTEEAAADAREMARVVRRHRGTVDCVIIGGGDGTLNAAAGALLAARLPLGILPMGTANDFARTLGIPPPCRRPARSSPAASRTRSTSAPPTASPSSTSPAWGSACSAPAA